MPPFPVRSCMKGGICFLLDGLFYMEMGMHVPLKVVCFTELLFIHSSMTATTVWSEALIRWAELRNIRMTQPEI